MEIVSLTSTTNKNAIDRAMAVLANGGLVIFPTETTYGAGVDATNPVAVKKLLEYKARREGKPLSIAVADMAMAEKYVEVNTQARTLYQQFLPGPVTVISKGLHVVAEGVESEFGTLGVRIPDYQLILDLVQTYGKPITATSANPSDGARPYHVQKLLDSLSGKQRSLVDLVLDAGELPHNPPSTVIDTTLSAPVTMRQGEISLSADQIVLSKAADPNQRTLTITESSSSEESGDFGDSMPLVLHSTSPAETMGIAGRLLLKHWNEIRENGLIIGLDGPLGAGKTVFAQGAAKFLGIQTQVVSPTYTYIEEYPFTRHQTSGMFYHLDMWKVDSEELFHRLELEKLMGPQNVLVIEWWSQIEGWLSRKLINLIKCSISDTESA